VVSNGIDDPADGTCNLLRDFQIHVVSGGDDHLPAIPRELGKLALALFSLLLILRRGNVQVGVRVTALVS
jgi:hypothetical protein